MESHASARRTAAPDSHPPHRSGPSPPPRSSSLPRACWPPPRRRRRPATSTRSFSGDGKQITDFGGVDCGAGVAIQADGKIVVAGARRRATSRSPATTPTARSTPSFAGDGKADHRLRRARDHGRGRRDPGRRQDRGRRRGVRGDGLRARPLQRRRLARHHLRGRRQADDRLRRRRTTARAWRSRPTARSSSRGRGDGGLRARPLQRRRLARHHLRGRRQADDRLRRLGPGAAPSRSRPTARSWSPGASRRRRTSRWPATTPTARSTRPSRATAS